MLSPSTISQAAISWWSFALTPRLMTDFYRLNSNETWMLVKMLASPPDLSRHQSGCQSQASSRLNTL